MTITFSFLRAHSTHTGRKALRDLIGLGHVGDLECVKELAQAELELNRVRAALHLNICDTCMREREHK